MLSSVLRAIHTPSLMGVAWRMLAKSSSCSTWYMLGSWRACCGG